MTIIEQQTIAGALDLAAHLHLAGRLTDAKTLYLRLAKLQPGNANIFAHLGAIFDAEAQLPQAIEFYKQAIALNPHFAAAHYNLANAYRDVSLLDLSLPHYRMALEINPHHEDALACLHHALQHVCAWDEYEKLTPAVDNANNKAIKAGKRTAETPFVNITRCDNAKTNLEITNSWANYIQNKAGIHNKIYTFNRKITNNNKITIGYLSRDFQDRPTGHLTSELFSLHNKDEFIINAYSYGADENSEYRQRIKSGCNNFVDITKMDFHQAAQKIYDDKVDILIDLQGYMAGTRLEIAAMHPAPIQVNYLGFPGTIGGGIFDYIIADNICIPATQADFFDEKIAYLPDCYQANDSKQQIASTTYIRRDFNLPDEAFVFCSFNWSHKLDKTMFTTWLEILSAVPGSVLWLWQTSATAEQNLKNFARQHGISGDRLIFSGKLPKAEHLARLKLADLALDTRIYGGHTTTSDALWAGVPVVTMLGQHFASRVCGSLLHNIGLDELVTNSLQDYKNLAIKIALNPPQLSAIKATLANNKLQQPLFDSVKFVKNLEDLYRTMWQSYSLPSL